MLIQVVSAINWVKIKEVVGKIIRQGNNLDLCLFVVKSWHSSKIFIVYSSVCASRLPVFVLILLVELLLRKLFGFKLLFVNKLQNLNRSWCLKLLSLLLCLHWLLFRKFSLLILKVNFESRHNQWALHVMTSIRETWVFLADSILD